VKSHLYSYSFDLNAQLVADLVGASGRFLRTSNGAPSAMSSAPT